jgi:hypothetical protein
MEERKDRNSHSFTWGMIVGGALVFMLSTKKGREIIKELTEDGIEGIEDFIDIEKIKELTREFDDEPEVVEKKTTKRAVSDEPADTQKTKKKPRLFRRARK